MKRRINYTERKRISRDKIDIVLNRVNGKLTSFIGNLDLTGLSLTADAKVYCDAYHRSEQKRFYFGTVNQIVEPESTDLTDLAYINNIKFRVLIVDESVKNGLILAHADRINPFDNLDSKPILPVEFKNIGQQIWKVDYTGDEGGPILLLNEIIPNIEGLAKSNPFFFNFVYPAVFKEILIHMIFIDSFGSIDDPATEWQGDWLKFAITVLSGEDPPESLDRSDENFNNEDVERWIDRIISNFCSSRKEWSQLINDLSGE